MKLYLFLRSIIWTSVISALFAGASIIFAIALPDSSLPVPLGLASIAFAILSPRRTDY